MCITQLIAIIVSCSNQDAADRVYRYITRCITILILLFLLYIFFSIGAIGAGDLKLLAVTVICFERPALFFAVTFIIAAVLSLIQIYRFGVLIPRIRYLIEYCKDVYVSKIPKPYSVGDAKEKIKYSIHLSLPILLAAITMIALGGLHF